MTRQEAFKQELFALLRKYDVEMQVEEETRGYSSQVLGVSFYSPSKWNSDCELVQECIDFQIGSWENGEG
jgi:hypothetical protein